MARIQKIRVYPNWNLQDNNINVFISKEAEQLFCLFAVYSLSEIYSKLVQSTFAPYFPHSLIALFKSFS